MKGDATFAPRFFQITKLQQAITHQHHRTCTQAEVQCGGVTQQPAHKNKRRKERCHLACVPSQGERWAQSATMEGDEPAFDTFAHPDSSPAGGEHVSDEHSEERSRSAWCRNFAVEDGPLYPDSAENSAMVDAVQQPKQVRPSSQVLNAAAQVALCSSSSSPAGVSGAQIGGLLRDEPTRQESQSPSDSIQEGMVAEREFLARPPPSTGETAPRSCLFTERLL